MKSGGGAGGNNPHKFCFKCGSHNHRRQNCNSSLARVRHYRWVEVRGPGHAHRARRMREGAHYARIQRIIGMDQFQENQRRIEAVRLRERRLERSELNQQRSAAPRRLESGRIGQRRNAVRGDPRYNRRSYQQGEAGRLRQRNEERNRRREEPPRQAGQLGSVPGRRSAVVGRPEGGMRVRRYRRLQNGEVMRVEEREAVQLGGVSSRQRNDSIPSLREEGELEEDDADNQAAQADGLGGVNVEEDYFNMDPTYKIGYWKI